jgi:hypothetical protein
MPVFNQSLTLIVLERTTQEEEAIAADNFVNSKCEAG